MFINSERILMKTDNIYNIFPWGNNEQLANSCAASVSDRKVFLSKGKLKCAGSSLFLKKKWGIGYHLRYSHFKIIEL